MAKPVRLLELWCDDCGPGAYRRCDGRLRASAKRNGHAYVRDDPQGRRIRPASPTIFGVTGRPSRQPNGYRPLYRRHDRLSTQRRVLQLPKHPKNTCRGQKQELGLVGGKTGSLVPQAVHPSPLPIKMCCTFQSPKNIGPLVRFSGNLDMVIYRGKPTGAPHGKRDK